MTGNKFGVGPLRYRLYSSGAAIALLLDEVDSGWKKDIFKDGVYLYSKLKNEVSLDNKKKSQLITRAKEEYDYDNIEKVKKQFEEEVRDEIRIKTDWV